MKQIKPSSETHKEVNNKLIDVLKDTSLKDNLIKLQKEVMIGKNFTGKKDIKKYQKKCEEFLFKINNEIDKITNVYNENYIKETGSEVFNINIYNRLDFKKYKDKFILTYFDRLPKDAKSNLKSNPGMTAFFTSICFKIQEYINNQNLYPKPAFNKAHIIFETIYDKSSKKYIWDNDNISRFHIREIINALVFVGIINSDEGLNTSFEVRSSLENISDKKKTIINKYNTKNNCVAYTKISIIPY